MFFSCKKRSTYLRFSEKQLDFVNYSEGQIIKFIDTASTLQILKQNQYRRYFHEQIGILGRTGIFTEEYEVAYRAENNGGLGLQISVSALGRSLYVEIESYWNFYAIVLDSLQSTIPSLSVNGKIYRNVYPIKMYKHAQYIDNSDTATLFSNREYGIIQLVFPNGKKIVRAD